MLKGAQGDQSFIVDQPQQQVVRQLDMDAVFVQEEQDLNSWMRSLHRSFSRAEVYRIAQKFEIWKLKLNPKAREIGKLKECLNF